MNGGVNNEDKIIYSHSGDGAASRFIAPSLPSLAKPK